MLFNSRPIGPPCTCTRHDPVGTAGGLSSAKSIDNPNMDLLSIGLHGPRYNRTGHNDRLFGHYAIRARAAGDVAAAYG